MAKNKNESPSTRIGARTITDSWIITADSKEIAVVTMTVTTLQDFRKSHVEELLSNIARNSRLFYLKAGNVLNAGAKKLLSFGEVWRSWPLSNPAAGSGGRGHNRGTVKGGEHNGEAASRHNKRAH